ncbi:MAG: hypothetical protein Q7J84_12635 [Sulfuricaulis sp.]|nr:hypothetical protein [Sulfuricaulis sp.]
MTIGTVVLEAELFDTPTAEAIWNALPFSSKWRRSVRFRSSFSV